MTASASPITSRAGRRRHRRTAPHPILRPAGGPPSVDAAAAPTPASHTPTSPARRAKSARRPAASVGAARPGWTVIGRELIAAGGVATAEELVFELFGCRPGDADFKKKRAIVYRLEPGRAPFGRTLWDRAALGHAMLGPAGRADTPTFIEATSWGDAFSHGTVTPGRGGY
jgi:hypothetical protein